LQLQSTVSITSTSKPFLKWPGGKRQLLSNIVPAVPSHFNGYFEPFLGGGALFFQLINRNHDLPAYISDINSDLVGCYMMIRDQVHELISILKYHKRRYLQNPSKYYYFVRDEFESVEKLERAARLIFLNKTCFNGLYRVNKSGKFNVPLGNYPDPDIVCEDNLLAVSHLLRNKNIKIKTCDFSKALFYAKKDDFIFLDPPYYPSCQSAKNTHYFRDTFDLGEHIRVLKEFKKLDSKGCKVMLCNSNTKTVRELFSEYSLTTTKINGLKVINSDGKGRSNHKQLIIKNY